MGGGGGNDWQREELGSREAQGGRRGGGALSAASPGLQGHALCDLGKPNSLNLSSLSVKWSTNTLFTGSLWKAIQCEVQCASGWSELAPKAESSTFPIITGVGRGHSAKFLCARSSHLEVGGG